MNNLGIICDSLRDQLEARNSARDRAIALSRHLIRACSAAIRALHRNEWENADAKLGEAAAMARDLKAGVAAYPELYHAGYTQDALKELAEAHITSAIIRSHPLPSPADLEIEPGDLSQRAWRSSHRIAPIHPRHHAPRRRPQPGSRIAPARHGRDLRRTRQLRLSRCFDAWLEAANRCRARRAGTDPRRSNEQPARSKAARRAKSSRSASGQ